jgi:DNA-binding MarR family transcriptional regulator
MGRITYMVHCVKPFVMGANSQLDYNKHCYYIERMEENVASMLSQVARLMRRTFDVRAKEIGVTRPQWQVLGLLVSYPGINQGALAERLEVEPITAGRMIDRLQDADLVERRADPGDRRAWLLYPTPHGEELFAQLRPFALETLELALDGISPGERESLAAILGRIRGNLSRRTSIDVPAAPPAAPEVAVGG